MKSDLPDFAFNIKRINPVLFPLKLTEKLRFSDGG